MSLWTILKDSRLGCLLRSDEPAFLSFADRLAAVLNPHLPSLRLNRSGYLLVALKELDFEAEFDV